jgi:hypothetical protein
LAFELEPQRVRVRDTHASFALAAEISISRARSRHAYSVKVLDARYAVIVRDTFDGVRAALALEERARRPRSGADDAADA